MDNRRLFLAALLSLAVLFLWQWVFPPAKPEIGGEPAPSTRPAMSPDAGRPPEDTEATAVAIDREPTPEEDSAEDVSVERPLIEAGREELVVIEGSRFTAQFSNRGGQLVSLVLKDHPDSEGGLVDLVRRRAEGPYPFGLLDAAGESHPLNQELFVVDRSAAAPAGVVFEYSGPTGRALKRFQLAQDGLFDVSIEVANDQVKVLLGPGVRNPSAAERKNRFAKKSTIYRRAAEVETLEAAKVETRTIVAGDGIDWVGLQDNYFLAVWIAESGLSDVVVRPVLEFPSADGNRFRALSADVELTEEEEDLPRELACEVRSEKEMLAGRVYFGAKQFDRLKAMADPESGLPYGLEGAVELGFFGILARPLLWGLRSIHDNLIGNFGWAIILMTIIIRLLLFPLTHKSFVSMQKMQELNPKIQAIRQKYRSKLKDKQGRPNAEAQRKMNEEVMGLYKKEGVNPAGGCLPMLLQLPVLFAFYQLLTAAVELRHAPWLGWIQDLSAPDPFYVLPLVMGASQFIQQRMTPSTADPMQRRIFMLMPVFFTVLFLGFPSGLVLYWLTNNILGIVQQGVYRRLRHPAGGTTPAT